MPSADSFSQYAKHQAKSVVNNISFILFIFFFFQIS